MAVGRFGVSVAFGVLRGGVDGVFGLLGGIGLAMLCAAALQCVLLARHDWGAASLAAARRLAGDGQGGFIGDALAAEAAPSKKAGELPPSCGEGESYDSDGRAGTATCKV